MNDKLKIKVSIKFMNEYANDFNALCHELGLDPYCMNEGIATGEEEYTLTFEQAKKYGLFQRGYDEK